MAGLAGLGFVGVAAVGLVVLLRRRPKGEGAPLTRPLTVDPDKVARDEDRKNQQILLSTLAKRIAVQHTASGVWSPRGTNPVTRRNVLEFEGWRPPMENGKRRRRRSTPDAQIEGEEWPYIVRVDLAALSPSQALRVAQTCLEHARTVAHGRFRLVPERVGNSTWEDLVAWAQAEGVSAAEGEHALDVGASERPV
jgi:hypothetical protein